MKNKILNHFNGDYKSFYKKYLPEAKKIGGDEYAAKCCFPNHEDKNPSFNFNNQSGKYFCHGCGKKGDIFHFYGKINSLDTRRDFGKILKGIADDFSIPWEERKSRLVKTYDYTDADSNLLFQVCRMDPKDFRQRQPNGNGGWIWNLKGIQTVLYRLPEVLKADEVLLVEGEKDTDNLLNIGFTATTSPMGAKKWRDEYSEALKGKNIVLIPDNDNEGREHMARVGASLQGVAASLKLVNLPDLPSKGDVSDFIATFNDKEQAAERLSILIENAKPYEPPKKITTEDAILEIHRFCELDREERKEYLTPWIKEGSIGLISGWRGCGKTWFALGILDAISRGEFFGPWKCKESVPCLLLDGEMPTQDIIERSNDLRLTSARQNPFYIYSDAHANRLGLPRAHLANETWRQNMKRILITRKVKLWVIDNLASLASGLDENTKKDWDPINSWLLELRFAGISTIMLHHANKDGGQRGTSAREDNIDTSIILKAPHDYNPEDGARFIVNFTKSRVRMSDLHLVADTEFKLTHDETKKLVWTWNNVKGERKKEILKLIDEGIDQKTICETLDLSKGYVSKIKKQAINDGLITSKGKLSPSGFDYVSG
ncbi:MAG: AAA family ATPase [Desulfobacterales bacterium]|uniref:AAA family ATPase n=1 Tax=Candidatus Desulfatibia profunda TaxID=2841695 RepID=A0A8J6TLJ3_9BACT|nr:AAA family ATPase [Candidatus Desulfatibia profunda]MBL7180278.1 AAA family ATPase [Desulfobacterales bacterium]MBL7208055.1 AAA family ATPase [Desulfobacterales bacterium]